MGPRSSPNSMVVPGKDGSSSSLSDSFSSVALNTFVAFYDLMNLHLLKRIPSNQYKIVLQNFPNFQCNSPYKGSSRINEPV